MLTIRSILAQKSRRKRHDAEGRRIKRKHPPALLLDAEEQQQREKDDKPVVTQKRYRN